ncbi:phosphonate ABC transporter permease [Oleiphilus sp. HI0009]|nr:phosphonate ABC transporter permease [Oleiphilus sp. HI0009]
MTTLTLNLRSWFNGLSETDRTIRLFVQLGVIGALSVAILLPLFSLLSKSVEDSDGHFVGLDNFLTYFGSQGLQQSLSNSLFISLVVTLIVVVCAFLYAYVLTHSRIPAKGLFRFLAMLPLLAPSLLPAIALIYIFGKQGFLREWLFGAEIYGPIGIVMGSVFWIFPHAFMILYTALRQNDARLYESANALKTSAFRTFMTVTLPNARYGLISAALVSFTLMITDFGVPKVIGGQYNVLATDIYKQVIGQQNFQMGAVVSLVLLAPVLITFVAQRYVESKQKVTVTSSSKPYLPSKKLSRDLLGLLVCLPILASMLLVVGTAIYASFVTYWPYNLSFSLNNYQFDLMDGGGWASFGNSLQMAAWTALFGTLLIWFVAYFNERAAQNVFLKRIVHALAILPMAVPGMVLGLAYIFFFNQPNNPLNSVYGTMTILVLCTVAHFYTVSHLTFLTALKQLDKSFDEAAESMKVGWFKRFINVSTPLCLLTIVDVFSYMFINAMTTVSAVVFLYSPNTILASISVLNMDDAGDLAPAAAMAVLIMAACASARLLHWLVTELISRYLQPWRNRAV